jgi:hypothetical protein
MSGGWSSAQSDAFPSVTSLEVTSMFKKILLSALALSGLMLFASQADAHYGYGYGYGYNRPYYGYSYNRPYYGYSYNRPYYGYSYNRPHYYEYCD